MRVSVCMCRSVLSKTHSIVPPYRFALISIRYIVYFSISQMNIDALDL